MALRTLLLATAICLLSATSSVAQISSFQISGRAGFRSDVLGEMSPSDLMPESPKWVVTPELELTYRYPLSGSAFSLEGGAFWAYMDNGVRELQTSCGYAGCIYWIPTAFHVLGARARLSLEKWALSIPISISFGLARNLPKEVYSGGVPRVESVYSAQPYTALESGIEARLPIWRSLALQLGFRQYRRLPLSRSADSSEMFYSGLALQL